MSYKLTKTRKLRLEEANILGITEDLNSKSTREITSLIKNLFAKFRGNFPKLHIGSNDLGL